MLLGYFKQILAFFMHNFMLNFMFDGIIFKTFYEMKNIVMLVVNNQ